MLFGGPTTHVDADLRDNLQCRIAVDTVYCCQVMTAGHLQQQRCQFDFWGIPGISCLSLTYGYEDTIGASVSAIARLIPLLRKSPSFSTSVSPGAGWDANISSGAIIKGRSTTTLLE